MDNFTTTFTIFIIIIMLLLYRDSLNSNLIYQKSKVDGAEHLVQNMTDKELAADMMAKIKDRLSNFVRYLFEKYPEDERISRLVEKFNPDNIMESDPNSKHTSYSINKGEKIILCIRSKDEKNELIDENTMMFVSLHEVAHVMAKSIGHTEEFWSNFRFLLHEAVKSEIYVCEDYDSRPKKYCGIEITSNPIKCSV